MNNDPNLREMSNDDVLPTEQDTSANQFETEGQAAAEASRKLKRRIITAIIIMAVFAVVAIPLISIIDNIGSDKTDTAPYKPGKPSSVIFYEPDYDRLIDIRKDPAYLELDRYIRLKRGAYTVILDTDKLGGYSPAVTVLCQLLDSVIDGDAETYNSLFSERYFKEPGAEAELPFTMQRVYAITIEEIRERTVDSETDGKYTEYIYALEYKINRNDGTYRVDIGHDSSRTQYFMLTDRSGEVMIDRLMYMKPSR